jgi:hypothetical protein
VNGSTTTRVHLPESGRFEQKHFKYKIFKITKKLIVQLFLGLSHEVHIQDMCVLHVYVCRKRQGIFGQYLVPVDRGGILRGAAKKKKGQKKGRVVYKYVFGLLYEVFPMSVLKESLQIRPFLVFETRKKGRSPAAPYNSLPTCGIL